MREAHVDEWLILGEGTLPKIRLNSPPGGWFLALEDLSWCIATSTLPHVNLFLLPYLKKLCIYPSDLWSNSIVPNDVRSAVASVISTLPTSALQSLLVGANHHRMSWACFKDSFSSTILRCGPSLTEFTSPIPLSDAAVNHLIQLPHLRTWGIEGPPPNHSALPPPLFFPPHAGFTLGGSGAREWVFLFERLEHDVSVTRGMTPLSELEESLESLTVEDSVSPLTSGRLSLTIDVSFTTTIRMFHNLAFLNIEVFCRDEGGEARCTFKLNDDNVTGLAMALCQLGSLLLGHTCSRNTCATTIACLLPISVYCLELRRLEIHFNTTNIVHQKTWPLLVLSII